MCVCVNNGYQKLLRFATAREDCSGAQWDPDTGGPAGRSSHRAGRGRCAGAPGESAEL